MPNPKSYSAASLLLSAMFAGSPAQAVDVVTCGQVVPAGEIGVLTGDLDCSATSSSAVIVGVGATLDLKGYTLTGSPAAGSVPEPPYLPTAAVFCDCGPFRYHEARDGSDVYRSGTTPCTVTSSTGTGVIRGNIGIVSERSLYAANLLIQPGNEGINLGEDGKLRLENVTLENGAGDGISGVGLHARAKTITLSNVSVVGFDGIGILASRVRGLQIVVNDNGLVGMQAGNVKVFDLTANGNGALSDSGRGGGLYGGKLKLFTSEVTGNLFDGLPVDIFTWFRPKLFETTCGVSAYEENTGDGPPYATWGVCSGD